MTTSRSTERLARPAALWQAPLPPAHEATIADESAGSGETAVPPETALLPGAAGPRGWLAIALCAAAVLLFQVAITRVLSVVLWYHFAFLSISLAMLAVGAPGVWFAVRPPTEKTLGRALLAASTLVPLSIVGIIQVGGLLPRGEGLVQDFASLFPAGVVAIVVMVLAPLLALGTAVCALLLAAEGRSVGRMYGADLLGATVGALLVVPLLWWVPTPELIALSGLLPVAAAVVLRALPTWVAGALALGIVGLSVEGSATQLRYTKTYEERTEPLFERWTPTARLTVFPRPWFQADPDAAFGWGMGSAYVPREVEQLWLEQDGSAGTPITKLGAGVQELDHLDYDVTSVGYQLRPPERACIIGGGGGRDVLTALRAGAQDVDAVELNAATIQLVSEDFAALSGDPYHLPGVTAVASEGRAFLTRSPGSYDLLQISLIDSWAATAAGAYALSENYLYTAEAFALYWERLSPTGMLSVSRWYKGDRLLEGMRLALLGEEALLQAGVEDPQAHIAMVEAGAIVTLLVSKTPWTAADLDRLDGICAERGFVRHWPVGPATPPRSVLAQVLRDGPAELESHGLDLSPPTDDRPFFFQAVPLFGSIDEAVLSTVSTNEHSVLVLRWMLALLGSLTLGLFFLPFALGGRVRTGNPGFWRGSAYFLAIGVSFMLVEAGWIQRFILFLGHPSYATTVVIAALLLGAGVGSVASSGVPLDRIRAAGPALGVLVAVTNLAMEPLFSGALGLPLAARVGVSVALLVPCGLLMGFAFPAGMVRFGDENKAWYWALNGASSVLATVLSLALAMLIGFGNVVMVGVVGYLCAALLLRD